MASQRQQARQVAQGAGDVDRQIAVARIPLFLVLGWYDAAAQEAHETSRRYPDIQLDDAIARLRANDPLPWSDPIDAPD